MYHQKVKLFGKIPQNEILFAEEEIISQMQLLFLQFIFLNFAIERGQAYTQ